MAGRLTNKQLDYYQLKGIVQINSLAEVYNAQDEKWNRPAALHLLHSSLFPLGEWPTWAQQAIRASERLSHPGLLSILDYGLPKADFYWVTAPLRAANLSEAGTKLQLPQACLLVDQVAGTVASLHQQQIYLRDLRPRAIGIQRARLADGLPFHPILTDVGLIPLGRSELAAYRPLLEKLNDWPERLAYLAPEYLSGQFPDARCDVYTLGMLLHWLVVGRLPVEFKTLEEVGQFQATGTRPAPGKLKPGLLPEIEAIIQTALAAPADRFPTVEKFREQLGAYLAQAAPRWGQGAAFTGRPGPSTGQIWVRYLDQEPWPVPIPSSGVLRVGRGTDNDLPLDSTKISRYHVDIKFDGAAFWLTDRGSTNGTFLPGRKLPAEKETRWSSDQVVTLGQSGYSLLLTPVASQRVDIGPTGLPASSELGLVLESDEFKTAADGQKQLTIKPGDRKNLSVKVTNYSREKGRQLNLVVEGIEWTWRDPLPTVLPLAANRIERTTLPLKPPKGASTSPGDYTLTVRAEDKNNPLVAAADHCILTIEPDYEFESWLDNELVAPGVIPVNDISATLNIENKGNVDQTFEITFNPNRGLERLKDNKVKVNKGSTPKPVAIKPSRFPFGFAPYNKISVEVKSQESEEIKSLNLRSANPRSVFWGTIALVVALMMCGTVTYYQAFIAPGVTPTGTAAADTGGTVELSPVATEESGPAEAVSPAGTEESQAAAETRTAAQFAAGNATANAEAAAQTTPPPPPVEPTKPPTITPTLVTPSPTPTLPPEKLGFSQQPPLSVFPGTPIATSITVNVADKNGTPVPGITNNVVLELVYPTNNQTEVLAARSAVDGVATFSNLVINAEANNNYQLLARSPGLTETRSNLFNILPSPPAATSLHFTRPPTDTERYIPMVVTVEIHDQSGKITEVSAGVNVAIVNQETGQQSQTAAVAVSGVAFIEVSTDNLEPGSYRMTVSSPGLASTPEATFAITPPTARGLAFQTQPPATVVVGDEFDVTVAIVDVKGTPVPVETRAVLLSLQGNSRFELLAEANPQTASQGIAAFNDLIITDNYQYYLPQTESSQMSVGLYRLIAKVEGLEEKESNAFTISTPTPTPSPTPTDTLTPTPTSTFTPTPTPTDTPTPTSLPDLIVSIFSPDQTENGIFVFVEILNQGKGAAGPFEVHLLDNRGEIPPIRCNWRLENLVSQERRVVQCSDIRTPSPDSYSIVVDVLNEVIESNENNNVYPIWQ